MLKVSLLQVSGEIPAVLRAVVEIGCQLRWTSDLRQYMFLTSGFLYFVLKLLPFAMYRDNPPKQVIAVSTNNNGFPRQPQPFVDPTSGALVLCRTSHKFDYFFHSATMCIIEY